MPRDQDSLELRTQNTNTKTRTRKQNVTIPVSRISSYYRMLFVVCMVLLLDCCEASNGGSATKKQNRSLTIDDYDKMENELDDLYDDEDLDDVQPLHCMIPGFPVPAGMKGAAASPQDSLEHIKNTWYAKGKTQVDTAIDNIYYLLNHSDRGGMKGQVPKNIIDDLFVIMKKWSDAKSYGEDTWAYSYPSIKKYVQEKVREHNAAEAVIAQQRKVEHDRRVQEHQEANNKLLTELFQPFKKKFNEYDFLPKFRKELETAAAVYCRIDRHPSYKTFNALKSLYLEHGESGDGLLKYIWNYMGKTGKSLQVIIPAYRKIWEAETSRNPKEFLRCMEDTLKRDFSFRIDQEIEKIETRNLNAMDAVFPKHK